eukprot:2495209-Pleurochrysis_carterae.AAC.1
MQTQSQSAAHAQVRAGAWLLLAVAAPLDSELAASELLRAATCSATSFERSKPSSAACRSITRAFLPLLQREWAAGRHTPSARA